MVMNTRKIPRLDEIHIDKSIISERFQDKKASRYDSSYSNGRRKKEARESRTKHSDYQNNNSKDHSADDFTDDEQLRNKSEIHKLAERVCGDWSEHVSRNGKRYFYNSRTEKSQWDRPENWIDDDSIAFISKSPERNKNHEKSRQYKADRSNHPGMMESNKSRLLELTDIRHRTDYGNNFKRRIDIPTERYSHNMDYNKKISDDRDRLNLRTDKNYLSEHRQVRSESTNSRDNSYNSKLDYSRYDGNPRSYRTNVKSSERVNSSMHKSIKNDDYNHRNEFSDNRQKRTFNQRHEENKTRKRHKISSPNFSNKYKRTSSISQSPSPNRSPSVIRIGSADEMDEVDPIISTTMQNGCPEVIDNINECKKDNSVCEDMEISPNISPLQDPRKKPKNVTSAPPSQPLLNPLESHNFLTSLQQSVLQLSSCGEVEVGNEKISATQLAFLPVLLTQLSVIQQSGCQAQNQHIIQQAIPLLMRLQEMLVAQQQQRQLQQRQLQQLQLQQLLLQLLKMQKNSKTDSTSAQPEAESPYSPPDSDDTPSSSTAHKLISIHTPTISNPAVNTPTSQDVTVTISIASIDTPIKRLSSHETKRTRGSTPHQSTSSSSTPVSTHPSPILNSTSPHHNTTTNEGPSLGLLPIASNDGFQLSASLAKYVDIDLTTHIQQSLTDEIDLQAERLHIEGHTLSSVIISQLLIDLKRDRSLIRTQEILSTLTEQRVISIRQQVFDVERIQPHIPNNHSGPIDF